LTAPRREEERQARYTVLKPPWPMTRDEKPAVMDSISAHANRLAAPLPPLPSDGDDDDDAGSSATRASVRPEASPLSRRRHKRRPHPAGSILGFW
jgi:hypothetical protein